MSSPSIHTLPGTTTPRSFWPFTRNKDPIRTNSCSPLKPPTPVLDTSPCPCPRDAPSSITMCSSTFAKDGHSSSTNDECFSYTSRKDGPSSMTMLCPSTFTMDGPSSSTNDECFSYCTSRKDGPPSMTMLCPSTFTKDGSSSSTNDERFSYTSRKDGPSSITMCPSTFTKDGCSASTNDECFSYTSRDGFPSITAKGGSSSYSHRYVSSSSATKEEFPSCIATKDGPCLYATRDCFSSSSSSITRNGSPSCNRDRSMAMTRRNNMCIANKDIHTRRSQSLASPKSSSQQSHHNSPVHRFVLTAPPSNLCAQKPKDNDIANLEHQHSRVVQQSKRCHKDKSRMLDVNASLGNNLTIRRGKQGGRKPVNVEKSNVILGSRGEIPRTKAALERSLAYTSSVRVTPVLNVPSCINPGLRKSKSNTFNLAHLFAKRSISLVPPLKVDIS